MTFTFATARQIRFGPGVARELPAALDELHCVRPLLVTGAHPARWAPWTGPCPQLRAAPPFAVAGEPTVDLAVSGAALARSAACDAVVAIGGGSVLDAAKAIAALATNPGDPLEYLEIIGRARPLPVDPLPVIALPTTAGTGSEVTRNAVLGSPAHRVKVSLRHPRMLPAFALIDPELTVGLPPRLTAFSGLDALTQNLEPFVSSKANPLTDALVRSALPGALSALTAACRDESPAARERLAYLSLCGGLALANSGLGAVHGLAGPLGGYLGAPHGALCARLLPEVMRETCRTAAAPGAPPALLPRLNEAARLLTGDPSVAAGDLPDILLGCLHPLDVPGLAHWGLQPADFPALIASAQRSSSMRGHPFRLPDDTLAAILQRAL